MRRRSFLGTVGTVSLLGLSGCSGLPFTGTPQIPTEDQLEYIEYYPYHRDSDYVMIVTVALRSEGDGVYVEPQVFGEFTTFELYTVNPNGTGKQIATLNREDYGPNSDARPQHTFDESTVSGGTILLILAVLPNGTKYTYGAFAKTEDGESLRQVAYNRQQETDTAENNTETS